MKKRLLASLLSLCLLMGLLPTAALAAEDTADDTADEAAVVCAELEGCIDGAHDEDCPLYVVPGEEPEDGPTDVPGEPDADPVEGGANPTVTDPETEETVEGLTAEEQLAELIAALPDLSEIDPLNEEQKEAIYNQISAIYAFAGENGFDDIYDNETVNAVIAVLNPLNTLEVPDNPIAFGTSGGVDWAYTDGVLTLSAATNPEQGYTSGVMKDYNNPASEDSTAVIAPWYKAFADTITEVRIVEGVTYIGNCAFRALTKLEKANIPASATSLGGAIFMGDTNLITVDWADGFSAPSNTQDDEKTQDRPSGPYVPVSMFDGCTSLGKDMDLSEWIPNSFTGVCCAAFRRTAFSVDFDKWEELSYIGAYAFAYMPNLDKFTMKTSITYALRNQGTDSSPYWYSNAFSYSGLKTLVVEEGITEIYGSMYPNCESLSSVELPDSLKTIRIVAFYKASSLSNIDLKFMVNLDYLFRSSYMSV